MLAWDEQGQTSGALLGKMAPLASRRWGGHWISNSNETEPCNDGLSLSLLKRSHRAKWWICVSVSNQVTWNYGIFSCFWAQAMWFFTISLMKESVICHSLCDFSLFCSASLLCSWLKLFYFYLSLSVFMSHGFLTLTLLPPSYKDPYDYIVPTWIIRDNLRISKYSRQSHLHCNFCHVKQHFLWCQE